MINKIVALTPDGLVEKLKIARLFGEYIQDFKRYSNNALLGTKGSSKNQLIGIIIFRTHAIEKGLSHNDFRPEFGKESIFGKLNKHLMEYKQLGYDLENQFIQAAISALNEYKKRHVDQEIDIPWFDNLFRTWLKPTPELSGTKEVFRNNASNRSYSDIVSSRVSIREFGSGNVDLQDIEDAIHISVKTPSVCNRQPWKVKVVSNPDIISKLLKVQGGFGGYNLPNKLLLVTVDTSLFNGRNERNEPYIDGGLFTMSLLYALESKNIATVALNAMFTNKRSKQVADILNLNDSEMLITFIAVGEYPESAMVPKSFRGDYKQIITHY